MAKRVAKPTDEHKELIILTSDVNYHVCRYVRGVTLGKEARVLANDSKVRLQNARNQAQALVDALDREMDA